MTTAVPPGDPNLLGMYAAVTPPLQSQTVVTNGPDYRELVEAPEFGEHDTCEECPLALSCMSGALKYLAIAKTREEQREGKSLPCVDGGSVRLKTITEEEATYAPWGTGEITVEPVSIGDTITTGTITIVASTTVPNSNALLGYSLNLLNNDYPYTRG